MFEMSYKNSKSVYIYQNTLSIQYFLQLNNTRKQTFSSLCSSFFKYPIFSPNSLLLISFVTSSLPSSSLFDVIIVTSQLNEVTLEEEMPLLLLPPKFPPIDPPKCDVTMLPWCCWLLRWVIPDSDPCPPFSLWIFSFSSLISSSWFSLFFLF